MKSIIIVCVFLLTPIRGFSQQDSLVLPEPSVIDLQFLVAEALMNNPEIQAADYQMDVEESKVPQAGALEDPELQFMQEGMPGFRWNEAMYSRLELMQMFRFPTKLSTQRKLAEIRAEHAHHDHLEKINEVISKLKMAYYDLWFAQQNIVLVNENIRLMKQFSKIAGTKYGLGKTSQQEVLKAQVEVAMLSNDLLSLRERELNTKNMLMAILNRPRSDTLGFAVIPEEVTFNPPLDTLEQIAISLRPMLLHDSLGIQESSTMISLAKQEYLPDFKIGLEHMTSPADGFNGWSIRAGMTVPFSPWTFNKANSRVEEANANLMKAKADYIASRNMILSRIRELYNKIITKRQQLAAFRLAILPQARQSLEASLTAYQTGATDFLMLIDAYRTLVDLTKEYFMIRMQFEQAVGEMEREVGYQNIATLK